MYERTITGAYRHDLSPDIRHAIAMGTLELNDILPPLQDETRPDTSFRDAQLDEGHEQGWGQ